MDVKYQLRFRSVGIECKKVRRDSMTPLLLTYMFHSVRDIEDQRLCLG